MASTLLYVVMASTLLYVVNYDDAYCMNYYTLMHLLTSELPHIKFILCF